MPCLILLVVFLSVIGVEAIGRCGWLSIIKSDSRFTTLADLRLFIFTQLHRELSTITTTNNREQQMKERWNIPSLEEARRHYISLISCGLDHGKWFDTDLAAIVAVLLDRTIWIITHLYLNEDAKEAAAQRIIYCFLSPTKSGHNKTEARILCAADVKTSLYHSENDYVFLNNDRHFDGSSEVPSTQQAGCSNSA
jgi:hypothetical protein